MAVPAALAVAGRSSCTTSPGTAGWGAAGDTRHILLAMHAGFSDVHSTAGDILTDGDKVAWRWTFHGSHTGELMGTPATGKRVTLTGITIDRIAGGRIAERWSQIDMLGVLQQLGTIPAPSAPD